MIIDWYSVDGGRKEAERWFGGHPVAESTPFALSETGGGPSLLELSTEHAERHGHPTEEGQTFELEARSFSLLRRA